MTEEEKLKEGEEKTEVHETFTTDERTKFVNMMTCGHPSKSDTCPYGCLHDGETPATVLYAVKWDEEKQTYFQV